MTTPAFDIGNIHITWEAIILIGFLVFLVTSTILAHVDTKLSPCNKTEDYFEFYGGIEQQKNRLFGEGMPSESIKNKTVRKFLEYDDSYPQGTSPYDLSESEKQAILAKHSRRKNPDSYYRYIPAVIYLLVLFIAFIEITTYHGVKL